MSDQLVAAIIAAVATLVAALVAGAVTRNSRASRLRVELLEHAQLLAAIGSDHEGAEALAREFDQELREYQARLDKARKQSWFATPKGWTISVVASSVVTGTAFALLDFESPWLRTLWLIGLGLLYGSALIWLRNHGRRGPITTLVPAQAP